MVGLAWLAQIYFSWYAQDYVITNRRVMKVEGILKKRSADSSLEKINDAVLEQSVFGRMLGYGDLDILTANEQSVDRYRMLSQAQTFKRTMLDEKHRLEQEAFQIPAPPLRAPRRCPRWCRRRPPPRPRPRAAPARRARRPARSARRPRDELRRRSPRRWAASPTCAIVARSAPRTTRRRSRSCSAASDVDASTPTTLIVKAAVLIVMLGVAFPIHEFAHALAAYRLGDGTARLMGRLTLDPRAHFDPTGGLLLAVSVLPDGVRLRLGQAHAVQPDEPPGRPLGRGDRRRSRDRSRTSSSRRPPRSRCATSTRRAWTSGLVEFFLRFFVSINLILMVFNLIPIPPLDGSKVLFAFLDPRTA